MTRIQNVSWNSVDEWLDKLAGTLDHDCIVGISRGGAALAIALSYKCPGLPLHFLYRKFPPAERPPFYVFEEGRLERRNETRDAMQLSDGFDSESALVIDDVATFGDTLLVAEEVLKAAGARRLDFALYAVDAAVLSREQPDIALRVSAEHIIDNSRTWLHFPWQSQPPGGR